MSTVVKVVEVVVMCLATGFMMALIEETIRQNNRENKRRRK